MLEIFMLIWAGKKLARMAAEKGRSGGWAALGIGLWIGGELIGAIVGGLLGLDLGAYLVALVMAAVGLGIGFAVVAGLEPLTEATSTAVEEGLDLGHAADAENPYSPPRKT